MSEWIYTWFDSDRYHDCHVAGADLSVRKLPNGKFIAYAKFDPEIFSEISNPSVVFTNIDDLETAKATVQLAYQGLIAFYDYAGMKERVEEFKDTLKVVTREYDDLHGKDFPGSSMFRKPKGSPS